MLKHEFEIKEGFSPSENSQEPCIARAASVYGVSGGTWRGIQGRGAMEPWTRELACSGLHFRKIIPETSWINHVLVLTRGRVLQTNYQNHSRSLYWTPIPGPMSSKPELRNVSFQEIHMKPCQLKWAEWWSLKLYVCTLNLLTYKCCLIWRKCHCSLSWLIWVGPTFL